jgi:archaellum biogenesis protein FlaJ (TadC family)
MMKAFRILRNTFFALNLTSCIFLLVAVIRFPLLLGISISDSLGLTIHIAIMAVIFVSAFLVAVLHQLYEQEKMENGKKRW